MGLRPVKRFMRPQGVYIWKQSAGGLRQPKRRIRKLSEEQAERGRTEDVRWPVGKRKMPPGAWFQSTLLEQSVGHQRLRCGRCREPAGQPRNHRRPESPRRASRRAGACTPRPPSATATAREKKPPSQRIIAASSGGSIEMLRIANRLQQLQNYNLPARYFLPAREN